jgi:hypothetical protein
MGTHSPVPPTHSTFGDLPGRPDPGNGKTHFPPVHARVYDYSDAGMSVAQIASELGMGKGEVRLILSLRKEYEKEL